MLKWCQENTQNRSLRTERSFCSVRVNVVLQVSINQIDQVVIQFQFETFKSWVKRKEETTPAGSFLLYPCLLVTSKYISWDSVAGYCWRKFICFKNMFSFFLASFTKQKYLSSYFVHSFVFKGSWRLRWWQASLCHETPSSRCLWVLEATWSG